jgi:DNA-binding FrmR family transcriptional regulator
MLDAGHHLGYIIPYQGMVTAGRPGKRSNLVMDAQKKKKVSDRLTRIEGQIAGIRRMVNEDRYCIDILTQTSAVVSALRAVEDEVMQNHLNTCVVDAIKSEDEDDQKQKIQEVMDVIGKFRRHG